MRLENTLSGAIEELEPLVPGKLGVYACGVTPYAESHVGHAMGAIVYDVLVRYLRWPGNPAGGYDVTYVSNYTDIDDKVIERATEVGRDPLDLVNENIAQWEDEQRALNLVFPDVRPRVTEHIETIVEAIAAIIEHGYGYATPAGNVYFRVRSKTDYGKLSHRNVEALLEGTRTSIRGDTPQASVRGDTPQASVRGDTPQASVRGDTPQVEPGEDKEFPLDFALWKSMKEGEPHWPSPWGEGRPGWHIECSAMSQRYLGAEFDVHGGGLDLVFPHHENEIAQAEAATGSFAKLWLHNGLVQRDGQKMSKSLGNVVSVREAIGRWRPDALRLFVLGAHYRSPSNLTDEAMAAAEAGVDRLARALEPGDASGGAAALDAGEYRARFVAAMEDDLGTPQALAALFELARAINRARDGGQDVSVAQATLRELAVDVLGLRLEAVSVQVPPTWLTLEGHSPSIVISSQRLTEMNRQGLSLIAKQAGMPANEDPERIVIALLDARQQARKARDFARADAIRDDLVAAGIEVEDTPEGPRWSVRR